MLKRVDLHIHSHASDGQLPPAGVVRAAVAGRLDVIAITDHDTGSGVREAVEAARGLPVRVIPGIELSTQHDGVELHVLGYHIDPQSDAVQRHQNGAIGRRAERMRQMVHKLQEMGIAVEFEEVVAAAGPEGSSLGRPHLARTLHAKGHTRSVGEAFDKYLKDGGSAFVSTPFPGVREAIDLVHAAGGVAVWAHPPLEVFDREIRAFAAWGLDGVECYRPNTPPVESHLFETAAHALGLLTTGGSDWHGPHRGRLGDFAVREQDVQQLLAWRPPD
ncbi:MAG TPA: PHP domain-containing protein [Longimicrobiaceae bacterium]|nr:PHP domain-containing protein [Longimicrobiaceae bacterium]